jgi:ATP-grasp domain
MQRGELIREVSRRIAGRQLVYFGTRGFDVEGVADVPELTAAFSVVGANDRRIHLQSLALEDLTGRRMDLDTYEIDDELTTAGVVELRRALLRTLSRESVVFTYRPSTFLSAVCFARSDRTAYAGMFKDQQAAFEHKPWVESSLRQLGVPSIPWTYIADEEQFDAEHLLSAGPVMLRRSRSTGGTGIYRVESPDELRDAWPHQEESFVSVAPFLDGGIPTNVGGVVWRDGVTLHPPSIQLIGIPELTNRPFGYCGNDFGAARDLDPRLVAQMESSTLLAGQWLQSCGFRGAFGVDFLVVGDDALFTEVNPRLQGVSHLSCQLSAAAAESCVMLEHLASCLGVMAPEMVGLAHQVKQLPDIAHLVFHRSEHSPTEFDAEALAPDLSDWPELSRVDMRPPSGVSVDVGATVVRTTVLDRVTVTGLSLAEKWRLRAGAVGRPDEPGGIR